MTTLRTETYVMTRWGSQLREVGDSMKSFQGTTEGTSVVASSHGAIGAPMQGALDGAYAARAGALGATESTANEIGDLLNKAADAYSRHDLEAAERIKKAADKILEGDVAGLGEGGEVKDRIDHDTKVKDRSGTGFWDPSGWGSDDGPLIFRDNSGRAADAEDHDTRGRLENGPMIFKETGGLYSNQGAGKIESVNPTAHRVTPAPSEPTANRMTPGPAAADGASATQRGQNAPVSSGIMSEARMRELQGLPLTPGEPSIIHKSGSEGVYIQDSQFEACPGIVPEKPDHGGTPAGPGNG